MIFPTLHLNGTSREQLLTDYTEAYNEIRAAIGAMRRITFHARDYYVQGPGAYDNARMEFWERISHLERISSELEEITIHLTQ